MVREKSRGPRGSKPPQQIAGLSQEGKGKTARSNRRRHSGKLWDVLPRRFQHLVPSNAVKSIPEVHPPEEAVENWCRGEEVGAWPAWQLWSSIKSFSRLLGEDLLGAGHFCDNPKRTPISPCGVGLLSDLLPYKTC